MFFSLQDCQPIERDAAPVEVHDDGFMRLPGASAKDAGKYTCLVEVSWNGRTFTSARSIQLNIDDHSPAGWNYDGVKVEANNGLSFSFKAEKNAFVFWKKRNDTFMILNL